MTQTTQHIVDRLPDPDTMSDAAYRAIHELLVDVTECLDSGDDEKSALLAALDEVIGQARSIKATLYGIRA